jgi:hypothetical protein
MMVNRFAIAAEAPSAGKECAGAVGRGTGFAQCWTSFRAWTAVSTAGHEYQHHMVSALQIRDAFADLFDHTGCFMAERHRHRPWPVAVDHGQIGVTQARGADFDQYFAVPGSLKFYFLNSQRFRLGVRCLRADSV